MSETYRGAAQSVASTFGVGGQASESTTPLAQLVPYLKVASSGFHYLFDLITSLIRPLLLLSPLPILLYVFAPLIVFADILTSIFIRSPYRAIVYLLDALFPLYVFCGVACITGAILGLTARILCRIIVNSVQAEEEPLNAIQEEMLDVKGKGKKVERVKLES
ncbi:hypothetical protein GALMADRAFT_266647 [Galerina marginata CBS 339.88]|uniref:Uncharacterized protein n=1 Tax=Galerina marginata (strain CBS 339.88) TaxID=685588 RepID=A0A067TDZ1_GALM3|nr:hypothetical protein GALMADRAFT_266647 [Galerina marginata CBS 339.88]